MCAVRRLSKLVCVCVCACVEPGVTWLRTSNADILENCICFSQVFFFFFAISSTPSYCLRSPKADVDSELHPSIWRVKVYRSRGGLLQLKFFFWLQSERRENG